MVTTSPSSRKVRAEPSRSRSGRVPPQVSSISDPASPGPGPLTVPEAYRSPVRSAAPFAVRCASSCAGDQYICANGGRDTTSPLSSSSKVMSSDQCRSSRR